MNPQTPTLNPTPKIPTPEGIGVEIDDVNSSLWAYIKRTKKLQIALFVPVFLVWEFLAFTLLYFILKSNSSNSNSGKGPAYLIVAPITYASYWIAKIRQKFEDAFLEEFAVANNYTFEKNGTVSEAYGSIFRLQGRQQVSDVVSGVYKNSNLRLFLYRLIVGSGRYQKQYDDTVLELDLSGSLPPLLMMNKHSQIQSLNIHSAFKESHTIVLEGDFNNFFTLYGSDTFEIEAREVFTPDIMALMEDQSKHYSVEFGGNRVYIYANGYIGKRQDLINVFSLAKELTDKIGPLASRLAKDSSIVVAEAAELNELRKPQTGKRMLIIFLVIFLALPIFFLIVILIISAFLSLQK